MSSAPTAGYADPQQAFRPTPHEVLPILKTLTALGQTAPNTVLHLGVGLQPAHPRELQQFCDSVSNPRSPEYRHFIKPADVGGRFGASKADVDAVIAFLKQNGMKVTLSAPNRMEILADATVEQAKTAFQTEFSDFEAPNPVGSGTIRFFANTKPPMVPASIANVIIDISGLETYTRPKPLGTTTFLLPALTQGLYNTAPMYGAGFQGQGRTVGISNWVGFRLSQVPLFLTAYGLPAPGGGAGSNISIVTIDGGSAGGAENGEGDLDIQMVLSNAPLCNLIVYDGKGSDAVNVLTKEASDNAADIITESYGWGLSSANATSCHNQHLSMTAQGMTYMHATGDSGTTLEPLSYPDYDPEPLAVGGTAATVDDTTGARIAVVSRIWWKRGACFPRTS